MKNQTRYKSLNRFENDPRIISIWSEEESDEGLWADLANGYNSNGCSSVHEWDLKTFTNALRYGIKVGNPS